MGDFKETLAAIVAKEAFEAQASGERLAAMIEALAGALGKVIAISARGDPIKINTLLAGADNYMTGIAAEVAPALASIAAATGGK
jgi:hypothetical protein